MEVGPKSWTWHASGQKAPQLRTETLLIPHLVTWLLYYLHLVYLPLPGCSSAQVLLCQLFVAFFLISWKLRNTLHVPIRCLVTEKRLCHLHRLWFERRIVRIIRASLPTLIVLVLILLLKWVIGNLLFLAALLVTTILAPMWRCGGACRIPAS